MGHLTYTLKNNSLNSDEYYKKIEIVKNEVINVLFNKSRLYINEFSKYIEYYSVEKLRSDKEYFIELLLLGVLKVEYASYMGNISIFEKIIFYILTKYRRVNLFKEKVDKLRGIMNTKILLNKKASHYGGYDINNLIHWLKCSGEFEEELIRIRNWEQYLKDKDDNYRKNFLEFVKNIALEFKVMCEKNLSTYVGHVDEYLKKYKENHKNKEDIIYCGKGKIQYYFNMVCSEIMNDVYKDIFFDKKHKLIFLPACMKQQEKKCMNTKHKKGYKCIGCSDLCNINKLRNQGEVYGFEVCIIPHETDLTSLKSKDNSSYGIVGIACVLNLVSGGFKALRLGFIPQCIILDEVGCSNHWLLDQGKMTEINEKRLLSIFKNRCN